jgi:hypothetical protein
MSRGVRRRVPVLIAVAVGLVAALGGTVYAAGKINGHAIKVKSLPGNRLAVGSVPGNRLKPGSIPGEALAPGAIRGELLASGSIRGEQLAPGSVTGVQIDVASLGTVPSAGHADSADSAQVAKEAETALVAGKAGNADTVNGFAAGCKAGTRLFAGACWQVAAIGTSATAPAAAADCASQGGELPDALSLAAFAKQPGIGIAAGDEWTATFATYSSANAFSIATVSPVGKITSALSTEDRKYRCVIPLLG